MVKKAFEIEPLVSIYNKDNVLSSKTRFKIAYSTTFITNDDLYIIGTIPDLCNKVGFFYFEAPNYLK